MKYAKGEKFQYKSMYDWGVSFISGHLYPSDKDDDSTLKNVIISI